MTIKSLIVLAVVPASLAAPAALAAGDGASVGRTAQAAAERRFDELDRNRDGFLSRSEADDAPELQTRFSELDANNDDKLSRAEYRVVAAGESKTLPGAPTAASGATRP